MINHDTTTPLDIDLSSLAERLERIINEPKTTKNISFGYELASNPNIDSPYIQAAAVLVLFDPKKIKPIEGGGNEDGVKELFDVSTIVTNTNKIKGNDQGAGKNLLAESDPFLLIEDPVVKSEFKDDWLQIEKEHYKQKTYYDNNKIQLNDKIGESISYTLVDDVRIKVISKLFKENKIQKALNANKELEGNHSILQSIFTKCLQNKKIHVNELPLEELNALLRIIGWFEEVREFVQLPSLSELKQRIAMVELLASYKHLTGRNVDGKFHEFFKGRQKELSILREYVGVAPPRQYLETISRYLHKRLEKVFSLEKKPPLFIYGIGGVGKSTLLSKFILEHAEAHQEDRFPFVYLDFDRPALSAIEPETLLIDSARQLSIQYPNLTVFSQRIHEFYERWKDQFQNYSLTQTKTESVLVNSDKILKDVRRKRKGIFKEFISLISQLSEQETKPFLLVLDTFEEVQYKGKEFVAVLYRFLTELQKSYPLVRTIISGRAPVSNSQFKITALQLAALDREASHGYLERLGIIDPLLADRIVDKVGGNPLSLKLAVELVNNSDIDELQKSHLSSKSYFLFEERFSDTEVQGVLYRRILNHIHNPDIRKLAHPGLVLRFITPDLILRVLSGPCELLSVRSMEDAVKLFGELQKEVSLVTEVTSSFLRHRPDVRKVMLKLIKTEKLQVVDQIHQLAIEYYSFKEGIVNRAEELYHRLSLGENSSMLDSRWIEGVQDYLLGSLDELPEKSQAYLDAKTGMETIDPALWEKADVKDKERHIIRKVAELLNSGYAENALTLIDANISKVKNKALTLFKVKALTHLSRYEEAQLLAYEALDESSYHSINNTDEKNVLPSTDLNVLDELKKYSDDSMRGGTNMAGGGSYSI